MSITDRIPNGYKVRTLESDGSTDWTAEAMRSRKWGVTGTVISHSDSHGLCYQVLHDDGTIGWYNPGEIEEI